MGACCQTVVDTDEFKKYCMQNAGYHYQPILNRVKGKINLEEKQPYCVEGQWEKGRQQTGKGVIYCFERFYYEGMIVKRKAEGQGRIIWPNKYIYHGQVSDNRAEGEGELKIEESNITIKGQWTNGLPKLNEVMALKIGSNEGSVTFVYNQEQENEKEVPLKKEDYFIEKKIKIAIDFGNGVTYAGDLLRKKDHYEIEGQGIMKFSDGSYYQGEFQRGQMHGQGKFYWADRDHWYQGFYQNGLKEGIGRYYYNSKEYDMGHWSKGRLRTGTAESILKKQGEDTLIKSTYVPRIQELSPSKVRQNESKEEIKQEELPKIEEKDGKMENIQKIDNAENDNGDNEAVLGLLGSLAPSGNKKEQPVQNNEAYTPVNEINNEL